MMQRTVSVLLAAAKVGAIALAVSAGGYLIVNAQRRANPHPVEAAPIGESAVQVTATPVVAEAAPVDPSLAQEDTGDLDLLLANPLVLERLKAEGKLPPVFFAGSKSMVITDSSIVGADGLPLEADQGAVTLQQPAPVYLPSSKVLSPGAIKHWTPPVGTPPATPAPAPKQP